MTDRRSDDGFLEELEKAAKSLSVVTDRAASDEIRRLFSELQGGEPDLADGPHGDLRNDESAKERSAV